MRIQRKTPEQLRLMRAAGLVVAEGLAAMGAAVRPGATTADLDAAAARVLQARGASSSFLDYGQEYGPGFPAVSCVSVNDEVVHGIPGERVLVAGDMVSCDFGAILDGWHADAARTFVVGEPDAGDLALSEATRAAMWAGIAAAAPGRRVGAISSAIHRSYKRLGYRCVEHFTGHGIGTQMHMDPDVPNIGGRFSGPRLGVGMALAIEPMLVAGSPKTVTDEDGWTVRTLDGRRGAHWENTVALTSEGLWVLTEPDGGQAELERLGATFGAI